MVSTVFSAARGAHVEKAALAARVQNAIATASARTGVAFSYLYSQAKVESSLNPDAKAGTSSATGLYQFVEQSWLGTVARHGAEHGLGAEAAAIRRGADGRYRVDDPAARAAILDLRRSPEASAAMAAEFAADNRASLEARLGHSVEQVDLYLAHFLGAAGRASFWRRRRSIRVRRGRRCFRRLRGQIMRCFMTARGRLGRFRRYASGLRRSSSRVGRVLRPSLGLRCVGPVLLLHARSMRRMRGWLI